MNDILTARIQVSTLSGDARTDLLANLGPRGDFFKLQVPEGHAARLYDFSVFCRMPLAGRYGYNLVRVPVPEAGVTDWVNDTQGNRDGGTLAALQQSVLSGAGPVPAVNTEFLWDLDYRLVSDPRITGFAQVSAEVSFRLRYRLVTASRTEVASILFWQNEGVKRA